MTDNPLKPTELLPCPFCGHKAKYKKADDEFWYITCSWYLCPVKPMTLLRSNDKKTVNNEWNTRSRPAVGEETIYKILKREQMEIFKQYKSKVDHLRRYAQAISKLINKGEK